VSVFQTSSDEASAEHAAAGMGVTILPDIVYRPWSLERAGGSRRAPDRRHPDHGRRARLGARQRQFRPRAFMDFLGLVVAGGGQLQTE